MAWVLYMQVHLEFRCGFLQFLFDFTKLRQCTIGFFIGLFFYIQSNVQKVMFRGVKLELPLSDQLRHFIKCRVLLLQFYVVQVLVTYFQIQYHLYLTLKSSSYFLGGLMNKKCLDRISYLYQFVSYPWLQIITQVVNHNLGNRMLGQARPNSITQVMIYNLGYDL